MTQPDISLSQTSPVLGVYVEGLTISRDNLLEAAEQIQQLLDRVSGNRWQTCVCIFRIRRVGCSVRPRWQ